MRHPLLMRALIGSAGLAGCVVLLSGVARAADSASLERAVIISGIAPPVAPDLFGTVTLRIKPDRYLDGWERARRDASNLPAMQRLIAPARTLPREQQIAYVHRAVAHQIRWMSDATQWGQHDYWASAAETLRSGAGDMEDRAIVKMQALRALGFPSRDLYLTMGTDKVGGPITVLVVRLGNRYYVLDDTDGAPFTSDRRPEFRPMLTFGYGGFWIHGYPYAARASRTAAATAATGARAAAPK